MKHTEVDGNGIYRMGDVRLSDRAGRKILPIGNDDFVSLVQQTVFVDKSMLVADILNSGSKITLFCRPRRFGKSLNLSMLQRFFEIPTGAYEGKSFAELFRGLAIWDAADGSFRERQGSYPIVRLSLASLKSLSFEDFLDSLSELVSLEYCRHAQLAQSEALSAFEKEAFSQAAYGYKKDEQSQLAGSLLRLTALLQKHYGRQVVLLIDEYDAPVMSGKTNGYYDEVVSFLRKWLTSALKGNESLAFSVLTGVQRISKESIFSDLNNLTVNTPLDSASDERFGFTQAEVDALAEYTGRRNGVADAQSWYDGYRFGNADVYNPWSVLNYFNKGCTPDVYWGNTSGNGILGDMVRNAGEDMLGKIYTLTQPGQTIDAPLDLRAVFPDSIGQGDTANVQNDALWSMLYLAGYITTDDTGFPNDTERLRRLRVPNREIASLFKFEVVGRFAAIAGGRDQLTKLHRAIRAGDADAIRENLEGILLNSASYFDLTSENSYHMLILGLVYGMADYEAPTSNREAGRGRFDIQLVAKNKDRNPLIIIELKHVKDPADMAAVSATSVEALNQIEDRAYDVAAGSAGSLRVGIACGGKRMAVACRESRPCRS